MGWDSKQVVNLDYCQNDENKGRLLLILSQKVCSNDLMFINKPYLGKQEAEFKHLTALYLILRNEQHGYGNFPKPKLFSKSSINWQEAPKTTTKSNSTEKSYINFIRFQCWSSNPTSMNEKGLRLDKSKPHHI